MARSTVEPTDHGFALIDGKTCLRYKRAEEKALEDIFWQPVQ